MSSWRRMNVINQHFLEWKREEASEAKKNLRVICCISISHWIRFDLFELLQRGRQTK